ncbi:g13278 [Coccomyxa viridis]|uniref:G13278 protein n=1 Tax=Coccomyxa viridis TaxID=1274662 RepID=A0ABP1GDC7_9CHLO
MASIEGMTQLGTEMETREADAKMEEANATKEKAMRTEPCSPAPVSTHHAKRKSPEALKEEICAKRREAPVLEAEADKLDQQVRAGQNAAKAAQSKAIYLRTAADRLEKMVALMEQNPEAVAMLGAPAAQYQGGREAIVLLREEARRKAAPVSLGKLDTMRWLGMQSNAALGDKIATTFPPVESASVPKYLWDDSGNCGRPIDHLRDIIPTGSGEIEWVDAAQDYPELLSGQMLGYNITGATTDVLAAERSAVLTDLGDEWHAMWLDGCTIYQHTFASRGPAVGFIRELLAGRFEMSAPISQTNFAKRRQIDDRLLNYAVASSR